jgi:hypothetical protein
VFVKIKISIIERMTTDCVGNHCWGQTQLRTAKAESHAKVLECLFSPLST